MGKSLLGGPQRRSEKYGQWPDGGRGTRKEAMDGSSQTAFIQSLPVDGSVTGPAAAAHDHFLPECLTLREVPGIWQQLWADSHLQVPSPLLPSTHLLWHLALP